MAPFPPIRVVLLCEAMRQETANKQTLLGFYGVAEDVEITVENSHQPVGQLAFLVAAAPATLSTVYQVGVEILAPDGRKIVESSENPFRVERDRRIQLGINLVGFPLAGDGTYRFVLVVDGVKQPAHTFRVRQVDTPPT
jgi:hypothetical protein